ncbi:hydroxyacid dehydrogenase [Flagellimonas aquimarina]|jgi:D-lactate dehydrogenase|uniref:Hydroxyacid dehydrogenase n=1 Tax=Flagellimonas aquimarina TaxID=2201895 RepID=A0A316KXX7_9FLAO|nr:2-hydroxyacid dehydrogenase [Allomuricauda koreensis]PWL37665.1 hydroxyacid dehydrogenase [Allomuricauda koreensis]
MKLLVYSAKEFEIESLNKANKEKYKLTFVTEALDTTTAVLAAGFEAVSIFSGDDASLVVLEILKDLGVKFITLRSAGYNNVSIKSAKRIGLRVANAPDYSPHAIAEHAICLLLALNRNLIQANEQVKQYNFLLDGLVGHNLNGKTVGIVGTGKIGSILVQLFHAFGCKVIANDLVNNHYLESQYDLQYMDLESLCKQADIISINVPLTYETHHLFNKSLFNVMKPGALLVNTARGAVVKTRDLIKALNSKALSGYATDVYETEKGIFFRDNSKRGIKDEQLKELISFPNVLLTPHQAFVTKEALEKIAETTIYNIDCWYERKGCRNELGYETFVS